MNALPTAARQKLFAFNNDWYAAAAKAGVRGVRLELGRPYPTLARAYRTDEREWTEQLINATMVDPASLLRVGKPIARALEHGRPVRTRDDRGTDLTLGLRRAARSDLGRSDPVERKRPFSSLFTLPSGAVRVAVDESVADGTIVGNRTNYYDDAIATGGVLHFRQGKLTEATFERGGERFDREYKPEGRDASGRACSGSA